MTSSEYFEQLYGESDDPWQLAERDYEHRKFELTVASLPRRRYHRAFEPACSIGVLTALLSARCDELVASDPVERAVEQTRLRVPGEGTTVLRGSMPDDWPDGRFDLVVLSEFLYYLSGPQRLQVRACVERSLAPDGHLVLVHWRHPFEIATCTGDTAHAEMRGVAGTTTLVEHVERDFRLEVLGRG